MILMAKKVIAAVKKSVKKAVKKVVKKKVVTIVPKECVVCNGRGLETSATLCCVCHGSGTV